MKHTIKRCFSVFEDWPYKAGAKQENPVSCYIRKDVTTEVTVQSRGYWARIRTHFWLKRVGRTRVTSTIP